MKLLDAEHVLYFLRQEGRYIEGELCQCFDIEMRHTDPETKKDTILRVCNVSTDRVKVQLLVEQMNRGKLHPIHFFDVVEDFCQDDTRLL